MRNFLRTGVWALNLMPYDNITDRSNPGGGALVPPEQAREVIKEATQMSAVLNLFKRVPILTNQKTFPVLSGLPTAYFLDTTGNPTSDTALMQTAEAAWKGVNMNVAEVGVIAPMPRRVISDIASGGINVTAEMRPILAQAAAQVIDKAVFFGTNKPVVWPTAIAAAAAAAGNEHEATTTAANGGLHSDVISTMKLMRADGFRPNAGVGRGTFEFDLLNARDSTGQPLFRPNGDLLGSSAGSMLGIPVVFETDGVFPADAAGAEQLVLFDRSKMLCGVREEMEMTIHTEGVIQDNTGAIQYNLMQQDIIAIRLLMRIGIAVANPVTLAQGTEANRYPAAVLISDDGVS